MDIRIRSLPSWLLLMAQIKSVLRLWISKQHRDGLGQSGVNTLLLFEIDCVNLYRSLLYMGPTAYCPLRRTEFSMVHYPTLNGPWGERLFEFDLQMLLINFRHFLPKWIIQASFPQPGFEPLTNAPQARILTTVPRSPIIWDQRLNQICKLPRSGSTFQKFVLDRVQLYCCYLLYVQR